MEVADGAKICDDVIFDDIYKELRQYAGGRVHLNKDEESGIATICLDHPGKRNALSGQMMTELADAIGALEKWTAGKGVILYGQGNFFCSGGDLDFVRQTSNSEAGYRMSLFMHDILTRLGGLPLVSVALVQGLALGGGAELSTACDFRILTPGAGIQFVQVRMGIVTAWGGGTRLARLVGPGRALKLLTSCQRVEAQDAVNMGLADDVLPNEQDPLDKARVWLSQYIDGPVEIIRSAKSIVSNAMRYPLDVALQRERVLSASLWGGKANREALESKIKHK